MQNFLRQSGFVYSLLSLMGFGLNSYPPQVKKPMNTTFFGPNAREKQLTYGSSSHFLNHRQAFSPTDEWLAFDGRTEDPKMGENDRIGLVNVQSGEVLEIYRVPGQTPFGPGSGAVSYNPQREEVVFIRGLLSADAQHPYHFTRRSAMGLNLENKQAPVLFHMDARDVTPPFTPGALRGGSHAYSYSADGDWVSYTYNDAVMEKAAAVNPQLKDLRTVAVMVRGKEVTVNPESGLSEDEFSGSHFAMIAAKVVPFPKPGSDEIQKAAEETWLGESGYTNGKGEKIPRALAFLGEVVTKEGKVITEVFVTHIPEDWDKNLEDQNLGGTETTFPEMPKGFIQRRIMFTADRKFPGVQGPRHWLKTSKNGDRIFFYAKSEDGVVQVFWVSPAGGEPVQLTHNDFSPDTSFSLSPDDQWIAFGYQNQIYLTELATGKTRKTGPAPQEGQSDLCNINWSHSGKFLAYNKKVKTDSGSFFQVFLLKLF